MILGVALLVGAAPTSLFAQSPQTKVPATTKSSTPAKKKAAVLSFEIRGVHPHDVGTILNEDGIAIRTGHHCAQPVMQRFHVPATARASFAFYNTTDEVDKLIDGILKVQEMFS